MTDDLRATFALVLLVLTVGLGLALFNAGQSDLAPQRTPIPSPVAHCVAFEVGVLADSVFYEVWRKRGERCKLTLPDGARSAPVIP